MASIGGLDLAHGSQNQIVRTTVALPVIDNTQTLNEAQSKALYDILQQGFANTSLSLDFIMPVACSGSNTVTNTELTTAAYNAGTIFENDADNDGTAESTSFSKGGLLRNLTEVPLTQNAVRSASNEVSVGLGTALGDAAAGTGTLATIAGANLCPMGVLSVGVTSVASSSGVITGTNLFEEDDSGADGTTTEAELKVVSSASVHGRLMTNMLSAIDSSTDSGIAGLPEAHWPFLDLKKTVVEAVADQTISGADATSSDLSAILADHATNGRRQMGTSGTQVATFNALMDALTGNLVIVQAISIAQVR